MARGNANGEGYRVHAPRGVRRRAAPQRPARPAAVAATSRTRPHGYDPRTLGVYTQLLVRRYLSTRIIPFIAVAAVALCVALVVI
ncbi:MAG: hypothetical protein EBU31_04795, partial [Proteobacteria bacterium]|nr:hypothetical protein [Pseudomonadota bacterium]